MVVAEARELVLLLTVLYFFATGIIRIGRPQRVVTRRRRVSSGYRIKEELCPAVWQVVLGGTLRLVLASLCFAIWLWFG